MEEDPAATGQGPSYDRLAFWAPAFAMGLYAFFVPFSEEPLTTRLLYSAMFGAVGQVVGGMVYGLISVFVSALLGPGLATTVEETMAPRRLVPALLFALVCYAWLQSAREADFDRLTECVRDSDESYMLAEEVLDGAGREPREVSEDFSEILTYCRANWGTDEVASDY